MPGPRDIPGWSTPRELDRNYAAIFQWYQRGIVLPGLLLVIFAPLFWLLGASSPLSFDEHPVRTGLGLALGWGVTVVLAVWLLTDVAAGVRIHVRRTRILDPLHASLLRAGRPVWAVALDGLRVNTAHQGSDNNIQALVFVFDLSVAPDVLRHQLQIVADWREAVLAETGSDVPEELRHAFAGRGVVHAEEIFGEPMRGVWLWRKGAILPRYTIGLTGFDPREVDEFTPDLVAFARRPTADLRELSHV